MIGAPGWCLSRLRVRPRYRFTHVPNNDLPRTALWASTSSRSRSACSPTASGTLATLDEMAGRDVDAAFRHGRDSRRHRGRARAQCLEGGALPVVVTLVGWAALLMGVALLLVRTTFEAYDEGGARQPE